MVVVVVVESVVDSFVCWSCLMLSYGCGVGFAVSQMDQAVSVEAQSKPTGQNGEHLRVLDCRRGGRIPSDGGPKSGTAYEQVAARTRQITSGTVTSPLCALLRTTARCASPRASTCGAGSERPVVGARLGVGHRVQRPRENGAPVPGAASRVFCE